MLDEIDSGTVRILFNLQIAKEENITNMKMDQNNQEMVYQKEVTPNHNEGQLTSAVSASEEITETIKREEPKIGRNDFVKISNGKETKQIKFKKAKPFIDSGEWKIV